MRFSPRSAASLATAAITLAASAVLVSGTAAEAGDSSVRLSNKTAADIAVDDAHQRLYVSIPEDNQVLVRALNGAAVTAVTTLVAPTELVLSPGGDYVYVVERGQSSIARISTADHSVSRIDLATECPQSLTVTGGRVWFSYKICTSYASGVGVVDAAAGTATTHPLEPNTMYPLIRALPDHPERLVLLGQSGEFGIYDVTEGTPALIVKNRIFALDNCRDAAVFAGGTRVVTACGSPYEHSVFDTANLLPDGAFPSSHYPNAVAFSADGRYVAVGIDDYTSTDVRVYDARNGAPGQLVRSHEFGPLNLNANALAWGANGWLYAVAGYGATLRILTDDSGPQPEPVPSPTPSVSPSPSPSPSPSASPSPTPTPKPSQPPVPTPKLQLGAVAAVVAVPPSGYPRLVVTGTVTCTDDTDIRVYGYLYQPGVSGAFEIVVACKAGFARAWAATIVDEYPWYFTPGATTFNLTARALNPAYNNYAAVYGGTFVVPVRHTSPFGRRG